MQRQAHVAAAKAYTAQAARQVWEEAVQMHGAIGMTDDYVLGGYTRYLAAAHTLFGDAEHHLERLAEVEDQLHATT
jgi:alkylation response protein AidB-like acyl-CoA dehydrogenase